MAVGSAYQGSWEVQGYQGAWQVQSHAYTETLTDTISVADALAAGAGIPLSDGITTTDNGITLAAGKSLSDGVTLTDVLSEAGSFVGSLSDGVTLSDVLSMSGSFVASLSDSISLTDLLKAAASVNISDTTTLADLLTAAFTKSLSVSDTIALAEILTASFTHYENLADVISLADALQYGVSEHLADSTSLADNLTGVLAFGIDIPGQSDVTTGVTTPRLQPSSWDKIVTKEPSPIAMYVRSSANTTFTNKSVRDASSWDLSDAEVGDVAVTEDYFIGVISQVDAVNNRIYVDTWNISLPDVGGLPVKIPANGQHVTLHKVIAGKRVLIMSDATNDNIVYIGTNDSVIPDDGLKLSNIPGNRNFSLTLKAPRTYHKINVSSIWAVCGSPQKIHVTVDGMIPKSHGSAGGGMAYKTTLTDTISLSDSLSGILINTGPPIVQTNDIIVEGDYMYCAVEDATAGGGILVYNISDPAHPSRVSYLSLTGAIADAPKRIKKSGNWLFTTDRHGIRTINAASLSGMYLGQELIIVPAPGSISKVPTIAINGTDLYHLGFSLGLRKYDISDPTSLSLLDTLAYGTRHYGPLAGGFEPYTWSIYYGFPFGGQGSEFQGDSYVYTDGSALYAASLIGAVWKMGLAGGLPKPGNPGNLSAIFTILYGPHGSGRSLAHASLGGHVVAYCVQNMLDPDYGYIRARYAGSDPGYNPYTMSSNTIVSNSNVGSTAAPANGYSKFVVNGTEGYIVGRPGCVILTLSTGGLLNTISGTYRGHDVKSGYLYIAETDGGGNHHVDIYDISTPASPVLVGTAT